MCVLCLRAILLCAGFGFGFCASKITNLSSVFQYPVIGVAVTLFALVEAQSVSLHWDCTADIDCAAEVPTAICARSLGLCRCPAGHTFSGNGTACIRERLNGESCDEDSECAHMLTGAHCSGITNACECADGYTYIRGRCRRLAPLHGRCNETVDCFFGFDRESVACVDQTCRCSPDYYQRTENICRRKSMSMCVVPNWNRILLTLCHILPDAGDPCVVHEDCVGEQLSCDAATLKTCINAAVATQTVDAMPDRRDVSTSMPTNRQVNPPQQLQQQSNQQQQPSVARPRPKGTLRKTVSFQQDPLPEEENAVGKEDGTWEKTPNQIDAATDARCECGMVAIPGYY